MNGGRRRSNMWDYKPKLEEQFDKDLPDSIRWAGGQATNHDHDQWAIAFAGRPSKFKFSQHGQCGRWVSELLPHTANMVDDIAVLKTLHTNAINLTIPLVRL